MSESRKYYRLNCPVCGELLGFDLHYIIGSYGITVLLPSNPVIIHRTMKEHELKFEGPNTASSPYPQGGSRRSAIG